MTKGLDRHASKEDTQMSTKHMQRCSTSLVIREVQIKTALRYYFTPIRVAIMKKEEEKGWGKGRRRGRRRRRRRR